MADQIDIPISKRITKTSRRQDPQFLPPKGQKNLELDPPAWFKPAIDQLKAELRGEIRREIRVSVARLERKMDKKFKMQFPLLLLVSRLKSVLYYKDWIRSNYPNQYKQPSQGLQDQQIVYSYSNPVAPKRRS